MSTDITDVTRLLTDVANVITDVVVVANVLTDLAISQRAKGLRLVSSCKTCLVFHKIPLKGL